MVNTKLIKYFSLVLLFSGSALLGGDNPAAAPAAAAAAAPAPAAVAVDNKADAAIKAAREAANKNLHLIIDPAFTAASKALASKLTDDGDILEAADPKNVSLTAIAYDAAAALVDNRIPTSPRSSTHAIALADKVNSMEKVFEASAAGKKAKSDAAKAKAADQQLKALEDQVTALTTARDAALAEKAKAEEALASGTAANAADLARLRKERDALTTRASTAEATATTKIQHASAEAEKKIAQVVAEKNSLVTSETTDRRKAEALHTAATKELDALSVKLKDANSKRSKYKAIVVDTKAIAQALLQGKDAKDAAAKAKALGITEEQLKSLQAAANADASPKTPKGDMSVLPAPEASVAVDANAKDKDAKDVAAGKEKSVAVANTSSSTTSTTPAGWLSWLGGSSHYTIATTAPAASIAAPSSSPASAAPAPAKSSN